MEYVLIIIFVRLIIYFIFLKYCDIVTFKSDLDDKYYVIRRGNKDEKYLSRMLKIITGESKISLRIVDWFATNYAKKYYTLYILTL